MPGVTIKDINQQEFVRARAVFLKRMDTVKLAKNKKLAPARRAASIHELLPQHSTCTSMVVWGQLHDQDL